MREKLIELQLKADVEDEISENTTEHRGYTADLMIANGVRFPVFCKYCRWFCEYTEEYEQHVEGANGDCLRRIVNSENRQFWGCRYDDYCSDGKRRNAQ